MLDFVQVVSDHLARGVGLDEDALHWVSVAIRESVINAIKHGNKNDASKHVFVEFETGAAAGAGAGHPRSRPRRGLRSRRRRRSARPGKPPQVERPRHLPDPQLHGRRPAAARARGRNGDSHDQARSADSGRRPASGLIAVQSPLSHHRDRSGRPRRRSADGTLRRRRSRSTRKAPSISSPKSTSRSSAFSARSSPSGFRIIRSSPRRWAAPPRRRPGRAGSSIRSTAPRTSRTACRFSARRWRSRSTACAEVAAVYDPTRQGLFTAERGGGAFLNGRPLHVSPARSAHRLDAGHWISLRRPLARRGDRRTVRPHSSRRRARCGGSDRRRIDLCYVAAGRIDGFWESDFKPWDIAGGALIVAEAGGRITGSGGEPFRSRGGHLLATNGYVHDAMLAVIRDHRANRARKVTE